ncbi:response regulator [Mycobacterium sp. KBS0706]|uniref:AAA family ATPase n=1 Tax=Mycobacterium sp. KBS0706 TaxID=2578109 RepID=UPI00110F920A|nr:response regulator [Mycobacterium sp. KBS0706]TSD84890.1 response regulator [Mycobacterium sp. KBS0706]
MFRIVAATTDTALAAGLIAALEGAAAIIRSAPETPSLAELCGKAKPDLILLDADPIEGFGTALTEAVRAVGAADPDAPIIVLGDEGDARSVLRAIRAGAADVIDRGSDREALRSQLGPHLAGAPRGDSGGSGTMTLVLSGQPGGEGLFAVNLAVLRSKAAGGALLVDGALPSSEAGAALNVPLNYTIRDAAQDLSRLDRTLLSSALGHHVASGLHILPLAVAGEEVHDITPETIASMLLVLRALFGEVVLNAGGIRHPGLLDEFVRAAGRIYLVAPQKFTAVKACRDLLVQIGPNAQMLDRVTLVVEDHMPGIGLTEEQMREALGVPRSVRLPAARVELINALNAGRPLVLEQPRAPYSRALEKLAAEGVSAPKPAVRPASRGVGLFGRLRTS